MSRKKEQHFCTWALCMSPVHGGRGYAGKPPRYCLQHKKEGRMLQLRLNSQRHTEKARKIRERVKREHELFMLMAYSNPDVKRLHAVVSKEEYELLYKDSLDRENMIMQLIAKNYYKEETL